MHRSLPLFLAISLSNLSPSLASPSGFDNPSAEYRPKFRYWLPDASVPLQSVIDDVNHLAEVGAGGLEFLPFYNYGLGPALTDWSIYGFGTEAFKDVLAAALNAAAAHGLKLDLALGANQGAGVPSVVETAGLAKELIYGNVTVPSGKLYSGSVPTPNVQYNMLTGFMNTPESWGANNLVAVVAGKILTEVHLAEYFYMSVLEEDTLVDLTNVTNQGNLSWIAPEGDGTWIVFGIYERYTNQRSCVSIANATTALGNGSWVMTDFWDQQILSHDTIASLVKEAGEYVWEDSMEMQAALPWTDGLASRFESLHGYSITKYLPILFHATNAWGGYLPPYNVTYTLGEYATDGGPYVQDYKSALTPGYLEYLEHYNTWASTKGLKLSTQPAYNMPVDMTQAVPHVQVPELESLGFSESINEYRQFTGAAHLAGRNVISTELGAVLGSAYKQTIPNLKALLDGSFAAGVNNVVLHGYAYSGQYPGTTWPGYTPFQYEYSDMWGPRQPAWGHFNDLMTYSARNSMIMRQGVPKVDLAFYYFEVPFKSGASVYNKTDMNEYGYTFEYLGPSNLVSDDAVVSDGVLAPEGPGYAALVIYNQSQITPNASSALVRFARGGLPIYIVGTLPNVTIGMNGQEEVSSSMDELLTYNSVRHLGTEAFSPSVLIADDVLPRVNTHGNSNASNLYTFWTSDSSSQSAYVYLYNTGEDATFDISLSARPNTAPFVLDAWAGKRTALVVYQTTSAGITTRVRLKAHQTLILELSGSTENNLFVVEHSPNVESVHSSPSENLDVGVHGSEEAWVKLSNGTRITLPAAVVPAQAVVTLTPWHLVVKSYGPSANNDTLEGEITTIDVGQLDTLRPWTNISGIEHLSGVGTYSTNFEWVVDNQAAATIDFGTVLNTLRAWVNGKELPPVDPTEPVADISSFIITGNNTLKVEVTTTLFNSIKANVDRVFSIGFGPQTPTYYTETAWENFGLIGPVELRSLRTSTIPLR
ncbi:secreted protein [Colletotrichum kahawae]|uniref:Secreted protein n=1 Tax=Colletotrichum kahawae TaxID=34407 RepID=A0AAE0D755_COLKA|nr:secreted protein [Colletotrichum kahawae]